MAGKEDIVIRIAQKSGLTKKAAYKFMEAFKEVLTEILVDGERFHIHKVFTLETVHKNARMGQNPQTMEAVEIPAHTKVRLVTGTELDRALNEGNDSYAD